MFSSPFSGICFLPAQAWDGKVYDRRFMFSSPLSGICFLPSDENAAKVLCFAAFSSPFSGICFLRQIPRPTYGLDGLVFVPSFGDLFFTTRTTKVTGKGQQYLFSSPLSGICFLPESYGVDWTLVLAVFSSPFSGVCFLPHRRHTRRCGMKSSGFRPLFRGSVFYSVPQSAHPVLHGQAVCGGDDFLHSWGSLLGRYKADFL